MRWLDGITDLMHMSLDELREFTQTHIHQVSDDIHGKVMSLLLNMLSRLVITFLPRSKCLLISWPQSPSVVILEPRK